MGKRHQEDIDIRRVQKVAFVNQVNKTISCKKGTNIGIHTWGRIDFLVNHCGYVFVWDNGSVVQSENISSDKSYKDLKKEYKEDMKNHKQWR